MKIKYLVLFSIFFSMVSWAKTESTQLVLVTGDHINGSQATLQRYQRANAKQAWQAIGSPIPVVVGKNGLAGEGKKKEGDLRTPIGRFSLGTAFGFARDLNIKTSYLPLTKNTVCVDDVKSRFYNQIIDSGKVPKDSWNSGEQMREQVPQYTWGLVVNYNYPNPKAGAGSCIFIHVWKKPGQGTAGCIAMSEENMKQLLAWIDNKREPEVIINIVRK